MTIFTGKSSDAESTIMPACRSWLRRVAQDVGSCPNDHSIVLILNGPTVGVFSAAQKSFFINFVANVLSDHPQNAICLLVHPNRAGHRDFARTGFANVLRSSLSHFDFLLSVGWQESQEG